MDDSRSSNVYLTKRQRSSVAAWVEDEGHTGTISLEQVGSEDVKVTLVDEDGTPLVSAVYTSEGEESMDEATPPLRSDEDAGDDSEGEPTDEETPPDSADEDVPDDSEEAPDPSDDPVSSSSSGPEPVQHARRVGWGDIASAAGTAVIGLAAWLGLLLLVDVDADQRDSWTAVLLSLVGVVLAAGSARQAKGTTTNARGSLWLTTASLFVTALALSLVLLD